VTGKIPAHVGKEAAIGELGLTDGGADRDGLTTGVSQPRRLS
jgi:hypothetical protein